MTPRGDASGGGNAWSRAVRHLLAQCVQRPVKAKGKLRSVGINPGGNGFRGTSRPGSVTVAHVGRP